MNLPPPPKVSRGILVTTEGIDGGGKTTLIKMIAAWLASHGQDYVLTREPGGTPLSTRVRTLILDPQSVWTPSAELLLYLADRAQHGADIVRPALAEGKIVLCDRYTDSTVAYQGYGRGLDLAAIEQMNTFATRGVAPDITFLLDIDPFLAGERLKHGRLTDKGLAASVDRIEQEGADFFRRARDGFLSLAAAEPKRFRVLDAEEPRHVVAQRAIMQLAEFMAHVDDPPDPPEGAG